MEESYLKYPKEVITSIAQKIDMGMIYFLNTDTMEFEPYSFRLPASGRLLRSGFDGHAD